jgi:hypothetical protein
MNQVIQSSGDNLKIVWIDPKVLIQSKENNKDHRDNLEAIIESLQLFGWQFPLLVAENMHIISGHGRVQAAIILKMELVPVIISSMDEKKADEFRIIDNVTQAAGKINMIKVIEVLKRMSPRSKYLCQIKSIVNDISQIRHWMEDYLDPKNPNRNKNVDEAFKKAREYQDATGFMYTAPTRAYEGLKVTGSIPTFTRDYDRDQLNSITNK